MIFEDFQFPGFNEDILILDIFCTRFQKEKVNAELSPKFKPCMICFESYPRKLMSETLSCGDRFCKECYTRYFTTQIKSGDIFQIKCPGHCGSIFSEFKLLNKIIPRVIIIKEDREEFKKKITLALINQYDKIWCTQPDCGKVIPKTKDSNKGTCECGFEICCECRDPWHEGKTCEDVMKETLMIEKFIVRQCPTCKIRIEKNQGCDNMVCKICNSPWCWFCGKTGNGHSHTV